MKKLNKKWLLLLLPVVPFGLVWAALYSSSYDNHNKISVALLFRQNGNLDERAFSAAMNARFHEGAKAVELVTFVSSLGGHCSAVKNGGMSCWLNGSGSFCIATQIGMDVQLNPDATIKSINAKQYLIGC